MIRLTHLKNGIPLEWTVPTAQWLVGNGYQTLEVLMVDGMFPYGYGDYRQVPVVRPISGFSI